MSTKILETAKKLREIAGATAETIENEVKAFGDMQTKANEVMNTGATAFGKELIPTNVMGGVIEGMIKQYPSLLSLLPGNQGSGLAVSETRPIIGEAQLFAGNPEWTTGTGAHTPANNGPATGQVTITQAPFILPISVSKRELNYSVGNLESVIRERISLSALRTIEATILNGDKATSGNVNLDGGTPGSTLYYMQADNGLRKLGLANGADLGTFDEDDIADLMVFLGGYATMPQDILIVVDIKMWNKMRKLANVKTYDKANTNASLFAGAVGSVWGSEIFLMRDYPSLTASNGKVSSTAESNTKGSCTVFYKPAVQYGYGQDLEIDVQVVPGKGFNLVATFEFGFAIVNGEAGLDKTVATGYNITL